MHWPCQSGNKYLSLIDRYRTDKKNKRIYNKNIDRYS